MEEVNNTPDTDEVEPIVEEEQVVGDGSTRFMRNTEWFKKYSQKAYALMQRDFDSIITKYALSPPQEVEFKQRAFARYAKKFGLTNKYFPH